MTDSTAQVQELYERHPYPHYPLLAKPRWQDGYLGSSLFASSLIYHHAPDATRPRSFLSIGCGEILPYIIRQWEPSATRLNCVDLSKRSLKRAQFRTSLLGRKISFHQDDINELLQRPPFNKNLFDNVEAYGVLHHISSFQTTLNLIGEHLSHDGIVRLMVYNSHARDWIYDINRAFVMLGLRFHSDHDVATGRQLLKNLAAISPRLAERLKQMGSSSLENNTRFADTFMHPWESRAGIKQWFNAIETAGMKPVALYDRYAELDDLKNPLWTCPTAEQLTERAIDGRFENNLELWLTHNSEHKSTQKNARERSASHTSSPAASRIPVRLRLTMPPSRIKQFTETRDLPFGTKLAIWHGFLRGLYNRSDRTALSLIKGLDTSTARRLARMGLILPSIAEDAGLFETLNKPLSGSMSAPSLPAGITAQSETDILKLCEAIQGHREKARQACRRLIRAM